MEAPDAIAIERADGRVKYDGVSFTYPDTDYALMQRPTAQLANAEAAQDVAPSVLPERTPLRVRQFLAAPGMLALYEQARELGLDVDQRDGAAGSALTDVSFEALPGQHVAPRRPDRSGQNDPDQPAHALLRSVWGAILLDGIELPRLELAALRSQISVVSQEPLLFAGTLADNIRYGKLGATDEEVEEVPRAANVHDFISRLPDEYETVIGERGSLLSGGERQRISVARAFLKDSPIAILDEPTSSVDSQTEAVILAALERLMAGRTTLHDRPSPLHDPAGGCHPRAQRGPSRPAGHARGARLRGRPYRTLHDLQFGMAEVDVSADGRGRAGEPPPNETPSSADLLVAASTRCSKRDRPTTSGRSLTHCPSVTAFSAWPLIMPRSSPYCTTAPTLLRVLAGRTDRTTHIAFAARYLLRARDTLHAIHQEIAGRAVAGPLDLDLIVREPWTQLARVSPEAADMLLDRLPAELPSIADRRRFADRRATARRG